MENNFETKYKPLGMRLFAAITAFIAGLTFVGDPAFSAKAEEIPAEIVEELLGDEDIPEYTFDDTDDVIVDDFPGVTASYVPLSDEEQAEITKALFLSNMKTIDLKDADPNRFQPLSDSKEIAQQSMKTFICQYALTASEQQAGDTAHYIERSDNFIIKGRITVNTEHILEAGHMEFRMPMYLFQERNGGYCKISDVAVGEFPVIPTKDENGVYQIGDNYSESQVVFNYYIDTETNEYVFINYGLLTSDAAILEISYEKVDVFDVVDNTEWSIKPTAQLVYFIEKTGWLYVDGSPVMDGTEPLYLTQCECNGENLYMKNAEEDSSKNKRTVYYDESGNPRYVKEVLADNTTTNWYSITGVSEVRPADELVLGRSPMTENIPVITVCYNTEKVEREMDNGISGKIKTNVTLDSVKKYPESNNSSGYGAQLYTKGQMKKYINVDNLPDDVVGADGKLSEEYIYTCWKVYTKGTCTQPWSMLLEEHPKAAEFLSGTNTLKTDAEGNVEYHEVPGAIVLGVSTMLPNSYSKRIDSNVGSNSADITRLKSYVDIDDIKAKELADNGTENVDDWWYVADTNTEMRGSFGLQNALKEHKYDTGYYVVVAYPTSELSSFGSEEAETLQYPPFKNEVTVHLYSRDNTATMEDGSVSSDNIVYKKFKWEGGEYYVHTYKRVEGECKDGLLSVYDKLVESGETGTIGDIWFHESYRIGGYKCCHNTKDYSYEEGKYYKVVNTDDVLTAQPYGEVKYNGEIKRVYGVPKVLDGSDYFYSKAVLTISEFEVDPYEDYVYALDDEAADQKILPDDSKNRDWYVYGWYEDSTDWERIDLRKYGCKHETISVQDYVEMRGKSDLLKITLNFQDKGEPCPYRLKVEHNCIAYNTRMNWDLETKLKLSSSKFKNGTGILRDKMYDEEGNEVSVASFEMFRISLRNYSATKSTVYDENIAGDNKVYGEMIDHFDEGSATYQNIAGLADRTLVNANRYQFVDMSKFYSGGPLYRQKDNLTKSALGTKLLETEGTLESPYGTSEYLPLKYINGNQTFATLDAFVDANSHVYRDHAAIDISILETDARADKFASWENDTQNGQVIMTYTISGYEGYKLSKEYRSLIESMSVAAAPQRGKIILCDLLPYGVNYYGFEEPIAGKLTTTQIGAPDAESISYDDVDNFVDTWDSSKIKIVGIDVKEDWNNTGRTMVAFTVEFIDQNAVLTDSNWFVGCGIRFKGYVSWDNYGPAREKDNIFAYTVEETDTNNGGDLYGKFTGTDESQVYDGAGTHVPSTVSTADYTPFQGKTLENTDTGSDDRNRLYGHANDMENITMARTIGIKKLVRADENIYAEYEQEIGVSKADGHNGYTYKIHIDKSAQGAVGDVVIFDNIEGMSDAHGGQHGVFAGVDLSELYLKYKDKKYKDKDLEYYTTIWYSESRNAPTALYGTLGAYSLTGTEATIAEWDFDKVNTKLDELDRAGDKWIKANDYTDPLSDVKSIAIDFGEFPFDGETVINVYIKMTAPTGEDKKFALNQASYYFHDYEKTSEGEYERSTGDGVFEYSSSEITAVTFGDAKKLNIVKNVVGLFPEEVVEQFSFIVTSNLYYDNGSSGPPPQKKFDFSNIGYKLYKEGKAEDDGLIHATNSDGEFTLKGGEKAEFSSVPSASTLGGAGYDFDNYKIVEKSAPYFLSVESKRSGTSEETLTFNNYYRPVIYLTKKIKGVPEGENPSDTEFSYKIKIYDTKGASPDTPITFSDTEGGYKLLSNAGTTDSIRCDNKLYWYKVLGSAGWYDIPNGWKIKNDSSSLYNTTGSDFAPSDSSFTVTFDTKTTNTVAVPIYIQHIVSGEDVGMLYEEDGELKARYRIEIEEAAETDWYCTNSTKTGELGTGENSYLWVNNYIYKELLVKKTVTHAPSDLSSKSFTFQLTKDGAPYYTNNKGPVQWQLCKMNAQGEITPLSEEGTSGTVDGNGKFTVTGCGNPDDSTGDVYVIKLSYVQLNSGGVSADYTVTETELDSDFRAVKGSDTVTIKSSSVLTTANIENDYLKRDITIRKIVAASSMPDSDYEFEMVLCPEGLASEPAEDLTGTLTKKDGSTNGITAIHTATPSNGWKVEIGEGCSVTFNDIGKAGEKYDLYEKYDSTYQPLSLVYESGLYTEPEKIVLPNNDDYSIDVVNGSEGYAVLRKQFTGETSEISDELDTEKVTVAIKFRKTDGEYIDNFAPEGYITGAESFSNINNIVFKRTDTVIINMAALKSDVETSLGVSLDGTFTITETDYTTQLQKDGNWYVIEPAHSDAVWEFGADTKQAVIVNNVTKFNSENVIYKRIGFGTGYIKAIEGIISFTLRDNSGSPVQGVRCVAAKYGADGAEIFTDYQCISDENGVINIDFSDSRINNSGWRSATDKNLMYYLKLYFDREVKINPTGSKLSITENNIATDKSWGAPAGYEQYGDPSTYVNAEKLTSKGQWTCADADTFVNTQETEQIAFKKVVNPSGDELTDDDKNTLFRFTVSELIGSSYQSAPHISYKVYNESDELVREGITDLDEDDPNTGWGVFTLYHGEKAVLDMPKNVYWQVTEDNTGKYKLVTDSDGNITQDSDGAFDEDDALYINADSAYGAKYIAQGFEFHTTLDMLNSYPMGYDVVLTNGRANANQPMFAEYDESHDSDDVADDGVTEVSRTARLKSGQTAANNYYYVGSYNYNAAKYNGKYILNADINKIYSGDDESKMWSYSEGTSSAYKANNITLPDTVIIEDNEGKRTEHKIVGIGKEAYANVGLTSVNIPKYVKKVGDNAFNHNFNLANVDMSSCTDLKAIGAAAFADGSMSIYMPDTVETVEDIAFASYHTTAGTRNSSNNRFTIPSALCHLTNKSNITDQRFGSLGHYTSNVTLRIGGGDSIPDMVTSFRTITDSKYHEIYTLGLGDIPFIPYNVIIGQNPNGLTIKENARNHWDRHGGNNNSDMKYGRVIVFPKGSLTLEAQALRQYGQISSLNFLRVFLTENPSDLNIEGDMETYGVHIQYIVFPNLTRDEAFSYSTWATKEGYLKSASSSTNVHIYYKDDLDAATIADIISTIGTDIVDDDVKSLLYTSVGLTPPIPLPAPRHLTAPDNIIVHKDIYLEKKKELLD